MKISRPGPLRSTRGLGPLAAAAGWWTALLLGQAQRATLGRDHDGDLHSQLQPLVPDVWVAIAAAAVAMAACMWLVRIRQRAGWSEAARTAAIGAALLLPILVAVPWTRADDRELAGPPTVLGACVVLATLVGWSLIQHGGAPHTHDLASDSGTTASLSERAAWRRHFSVPALLFGGLFVAFSMTWVGLAWSRSEQVTLAPIAFFLTLCAVLTAVGGWFMSHRAGLAPLHGHARASSSVAVAAKGPAWRRQAAVAALLVGAISLGYSLPWYWRQFSPPTLHATGLRLDSATLRALLAMLAYVLAVRIGLPATLRASVSVAWRAATLLLMAGLTAGLVATLVYFLSEYWVVLAWLDGRDAEPNMLAIGVWLLAGGAWAVLRSRPSRRVAAIVLVGSLFIGVGKAVAFKVSPDATKQTYFLLCKYGPTTWHCVDANVTAGVHEFTFPTIARRHLRSLAADSQEPQRGYANLLLGHLDWQLGDLAGAQSAFARGAQLGDTKAAERWLAVTEVRGDCAGAHVRRMALAKTAGAKTGASRMLLRCLHAKGDGGAMLDAVRGPLAASLKDLERRTFEVRALNALGRCDEAEALWPALRAANHSAGWIEGVDGFAACDSNWEVDLAQDATPASGQVLRMHRRPERPDPEFEDSSAYVVSDGAAMFFSFPGQGVRWATPPGYAAIRQAMRSLERAACDLVPPLAYKPEPIEI